MYEILRAIHVAFIVEALFLILQEIMDMMT
jgi:hypothetical protein